MVQLFFQACRNFYDDGVCKQECPPMQRYNPIKYKWEKNPDGKYAYGATCVRDWLVVVNLFISPIVM